MSGIAPGSLAAEVRWKRFRLTVIPRLARNTFNRRVAGASRMERQFTTARLTEAVPSGG
jgi:hypothetical protein